MTRLSLLGRLLAATLLLAAVTVGLIGGRWMLDDRTLDQRAGVTEGLVSEVREQRGRDQVVVQLDQLDGREIVVTRVGNPEVGERLAVQYDPDGAQVGRVAGTDRDRSDGRWLLLGAAAVAVLTATLTPWRAREEHAGAAVPTTDQPTAR